MADSLLNKVFSVTLYEIDTLKNDLGLYSYIT